MIYTGIRSISLKNFSRAVMAKTEIAHINGTIDKAVHPFNAALNFEDIDMEAEDFLYLIEKEEQLLQEARLDDEEYEEYDMKNIAKYEKKFFFVMEVLLTKLVGYRPYTVSTKFVLITKSFQVSPRSQF